MNRYAKNLVVVVFCAAAAGICTASADDEPCSQLYEIMEKMNSMDRAQETIEHLNDGFGNSGTEERILTRDKAFRRWNGGPWGVAPRSPLLRAIGGIPTISSCQIVGEEIKNDVPTRIFSYERYRPEGRMQVRMWINKLTGLPLQSHLRATQPDNSKEFTSTFAFDPKVGEPLSSVKP